MTNFRNLTAADIECRVQSVTANGLYLLLYKSARTDMQILDEAVGPERWQREHYECNGILFCRVGILTDNGWVWKADCGTESNSEAEKGASSDSFKRACINWSIGRELYTGPKIFIKAKCCDIQEKGKGYVCYDKFEVEKIVIEDKKIVGLSIYNATQDLRAYVWQSKD